LVLVGSIRIDGVTYEHDVVIVRGRVRKRKKKSSKPFRGAFGHTPGVCRGEHRLGLAAPGGRDRS
jgi:hypothetical protein